MINFIVFFYHFYPFYNRRGDNKKDTISMITPITKKKRTQRKKNVSASRSDP
jgi:hypothetical protein